jgi:ParB family chromosome partitioning protein
MTEFTKIAEWYTPPKYIEAARQVMGNIDLDPASCDAANQIVKATRYYTREQNGLEQPWVAQALWLNPPYGRTEKMTATRKSTIGLFVEKLLQEYQSGNVKQAIVLATTEVNAKWFYPLLQFPICFPDHRVHFIVPVQTRHGKYSQMFGTSFAYLGPNTQKFIDVFQQFGIIVQNVSPLQQKSTNLKLWDHVESDGMAS